MKRLLSICCIVLAVFSLAVSALAVSEEDYWYQDSGGVWVYDQAGYDLAVAVEMVQAAGLDLDPYAYLYTGADDGAYFDTAAFQADYDAALAPKETIPEKSEEEEDGQSSQAPVVPGGLYPVGDYLADGDGNLYYPNGQLAGLVPAGDAPEEDPPPPDVLEDEGEAADLETSGEAAAPVFTVNDLRSADDPAVAPLAGLKALVVSIFGEYEPVMTTAAVTETVGEETTTTLVDTVASGAAGVDYEWLAGVFLFGILLFCLMRLLGGVLK